MKISNKIKQRYINLFKEGYFFKVKKFNNGSVFSLVKQFDASNNEAVAIFRIEFETNEKTAKFMQKMFGFSIHKPINYFGNAEIVKGFLNVKY